MVDGLFTASDTRIVEKRKLAYDLLIASLDVLTLGNRRSRLVGAKAIKLGSCDKHPAYC